MSGKEEYAVRVTDLRKDYKDFSLQKVSFALPRGYVMGLVGPNGAGKTTIIKLLMNLIRLDGGAIDAARVDWTAARQWA